MKNPRIFVASDAYTRALSGFKTYFCLDNPVGQVLSSEGSCTASLPPNRAFLFLPISKRRHDTTHRNQTPNRPGQIPGAQDHSTAQRRTRRQHGAAGSENSPRIVEKIPLATAGNAAVNAYLSGVSNHFTHTQFSISSLPAE